MGSRCPWYPSTAFKSKIEREKFEKVYNDGNRIFVNRLIFYPYKEYKPNMISLNQLFLKDLGINDAEKFENSRVWRKPEIKNAVFHTMVYEESLIIPLMKCGIPITVFKEREKGADGPLVEEIPSKNTNYVHQNKWGKNFFGVFHSKLILFEFDDRLRVVISSSNLYRVDWELMS